MAGLLGLPGLAQNSLEVIERNIEAKFAVHQMSIKVFQHEWQNGEWLILDVREKEEFRVSHLRRAIHVDPAMTAEEFVERFGQDLAGKHVLFYCSVGYRSSEFADRVALVATAQDALSIQNLKGGIFRWYNEANPVFRNGWEVDEVHSYDALWGRFVNKRKTNVAPGGAGQNPAPKEAKN